MLLLHLLGEAGTRREELEVLVAQVEEATWVLVVRLVVAGEQWVTEEVVLGEGLHLCEGEGEG